MTNDAWEELNDTEFVALRLCIVALHCSILLILPVRQMHVFGLAWLDTCTDREDDSTINSIRNA